MKKYIQYHKDGSVWGIGQMNGTKMHGSWIWYRRLPGKKRGTKMRSGTFNNGVQVGKWTTYDKNEKVVKVTDFDKKKVKK